MNLKIFYEDVYYNKVHDLIFIYEINPIFPFEDLGMNPNNLITDIYDSTKIYNFLKTVQFIYSIDQRYIGYVNIAGFDYIIDVDSETNITILGDNEFNWVKRCVYEDHDYEDFKEFCLDQYKIIIPAPDYEKFGDIERKFLTF